MKTSLVLSIPVAAIVSFASFGIAQAQECTDPQTIATEECRPLTRAEVREEARKAGASVMEAGECPNVTAAKTPEGKVRSRAEVRREAAEAVRTGKPIDMGECPA